MSEGYCECSCMGCRHFCAQEPPVAGRDSHHTRILLALDRSVAAACRSRGVAACDGLTDDQPCEVGTLHSQTVALAVAMADAIEGDRDAFGRAHNAIEALLLEVDRVVSGKPVAS